MEEDSEKMLSLGKELQEEGIKMSMCFAQLKGVFSILIAHKN